MTKIKVLIAVASVVLLTTLTAVTSTAQATEPECERCPSAGGTASGTIVVTGGVSQVVPGRGRPKPTSTRGLVNYSYVNEYMTPACTGNKLHGNDGLCAAAVNSCPAAAQVRFWIWHQVVAVRTVPPPAREIQGPWKQVPGTFCLGPDDPGIPTIARVVAAVQDYFASRTLPLPKWAVRADPGPRTLVNFPTGFSAGTAMPQTIDTTILGTAIHITAVPTRWTWHFGDGGTQVTTVPGRPRTADVTHTYTTLGGAASYVVVQWKGTFRVGNSPQQYDLLTPAIVTGPPTAINILQSRAQLIAG